MQTQLNFRQSESSLPVLSRTLAEWRAALGAMAMFALVIALAGCASGSEGLPASLPGITVIGAGNLAILTKTIQDGVAGRTYTKSISVTGGTPPYVCANTSPLPAGLMLTTSGSTCQLMGTPTSVGALTFAIEVKDSSQPPLRRSVSYNYTVRPEFTFTFTGAFPDGVMGRLYGNMPQAAQVAPTNVSSTVGNAPLTSCPPLTGTGGNPLASTLMGTNCLLSSTSTLTSAGTLTLTFTAIDSPILDTSTIPSKTVVPAGIVTGTVTLNVDGPFVLSNPVGGLGNGTEGSSFTATPTYTFSGGLPPAQTPAVTCAAGSGVPAGLMVGTGANICTLTGTPTSPAASMGSPYNVVLTVADMGNAATPPASAPSPGTSLIINKALAFQMPMLNTGKVGTPYNDNIDTAGIGGTGNQPLTSCMLPPNGMPGGLPTGSGLSVSIGTGVPPPSTPNPTSSCVISGTPNMLDLGTHTLTFTAMDTASTSTASNTTPPTSVSLTINNGITVNPFTLDVAAVGQSYSINIGESGGILPVSACSIATNTGPVSAATLSGFGFTIVPGKSSGAVLKNDICIFSGNPTSSGQTALNGQTITVSMTDCNTCKTMATTGMGSSTNTFVVNTALAANAFLLADGIKGRTFTENVTVTSTGGTVTATVPLMACVVSGLPTGLSLMSPTVISGANCSFTITGTPTGTGLSGVKVSITDSTNTNTTSTATTSTTTMLNVRPEFVVSVGVFPDGVVGRNYGVSPQTAPLATTNVSGTVGNAPLTNCSVSGQDPNQTTIISGANCDLHSTGPLAGPAGALTLTFMATDSDILDPVAPFGVVVARNTITGVGPVGGLNIRAVLSITTGLPVTMPTGTAGAPYPPLASSPLNVVTSGGIQPTLSCSGSGFPSNITAMVTAAPNCTVAGSNPVAFGPAMVTVTVTDGGNSAVPPPAATPALTTSSTLTINNALTITTTSPLPDAVTMRSYTFSFMSSGGSGGNTWTITSAVGNCGGLTINSGTGVLSAAPLSSASGTCTLKVQLKDTVPATTTGTFTINVRPEFVVTAPVLLPQGVQGRNYGVSPQTPPLATTSVSATVGNAPLTLCGISGQGGNSMASAISGTSCDLHSTAALSTTGSFSIVFSATDSPITDPANGGATVVPANTIMSSSATLTVNGPLGISAGLPGAPAGPMAPWTVNAAQKYLNATPSLTVTTTAGLPPTQTTYVCTDTGTITFASLGLAVAVVPGGRNCTLSGTPTMTATKAAVAISVADTGNSAVPAPAAPLSTTSTLTINAQATITTTITSPSDDGVTNTDPSSPGPFPNFPNRPYSVTLAASNGTGTLTFSSTGLNVGNCAGLTLNGVTGAITGNPSVSLTQPATATCSFTAKVTDTTTTTTSTPFNITIQAPLEITPNFTPIPAAVNGRTYGAPAAMNLVFTATGGLATQTISLGGVPPPTGITCTPSGATLTCNSAGLALTGAAATTTIMPTATDTADSTTAAGAAGPTSETITVKPALGITVPARIPNGLVGSVYTGATFTVTAGTGLGTAPTWTQGGSKSLSGNCDLTMGLPTITTPPPAGLMLGTMTGTLGGTPTGPAGSTTFTICVEDTANSTTPGGPGSILMNPPGVTVLVLGTFAYAGGPGKNEIEVIDTTANMPAASSPITVATGPLPSGNTVSGVAVTPDGRFLLALDSAHAPKNLIVVDTSTNKSITNSPFMISATCTTPTAVAVAPNPAGVASGFNRAYVVCTGGTGEVDALDISGLTLVAPAVTNLAKITSQISSNSPAGVAIRADNARAYVTLNGNNNLVIIDNTLATPAPIVASPFTLDATTIQPFGITVVQNNALGTPFSITSASENAAGTIATITTGAPHGFFVGTTVVITSVPNGAFDGTFTVASVPTTTTFTVANAAPAASASSVGGFVAPRKSYAYVAKQSGNSSTIMTASENSPMGSSGTIATITTMTPHGLSTGQTVAIGGVMDPTFDITAVVTVTGATTFTVPNTAPSKGASSLGGTVSSTAIQQGVEVVDVTTDSLSTVVKGGTGIGLGNSTFSMAAASAVPPGAKEDPTRTFATIATTSAHGLSTGAIVVIENVTDPTFDGMFTVASVPTATTFTVTNAAPVASMTSGTGKVIHPLAVFPDQFAVDPGDTTVFVTLAGSTEGNGFATINNVPATPALLHVLPLPDPVTTNGGLLPGTGTPGGVTIPPAPSGALNPLAYITESNTNDVAVINDIASPTSGHAPIPVTAISTPKRIASIPIPQ